jgi:hypothetical protein
MKKIILTGIAALAFAGSASAQPPQAGAPGGDISRAAAIADAERQFASLDANGNGQLEPAEMEQINAQRRAERRQRMEARLAQMSPEERAAFEQRRGERRGGGEAGERRGGREGGRRGGGERGARGERGPVTLAQFTERAGQRFDRLDGNRDGVITQAEQAQLRAQRGAERR